MPTKKKNALTGTAFRARRAEELTRFSFDWLLNPPSDHAFVLINCTILQNAIGEAIRVVLVGDDKTKNKLLGIDPENHDQLLAGFGARIEFAYCLGLYGQVTRSDLDAIRRLRNKFAHLTLEMGRHKEEQMSFKHQSVIDSCRTLKLPDYFRRGDFSNVSNGTSLQNVPDLPAITDPKERFKAVIDTVTGLLLDIDSNDRPTLVRPNDFLP